MACMTLGAAWSLLRSLQSIMMRQLPSQNNCSSIARNQAKLIPNKHSLRRFLFSGLLFRCSCIGRRGSCNRWGRWRNITPAWT